MIRSGVVGKTGRIRLKGDALVQLRRDCFERDRYKCQHCGRRVLWDTGHMAHRVSRGAGGSDVLDNVRILCSSCHMEEHNPKSVPRKEVIQ